MIVDEVCVVTQSDSSKCVNQDVLFLGTDPGLVYKVVIPTHMSEGQASLSQLLWMRYRESEVPVHTIAKLVIQLLSSATNSAPLSVTLCKVTVTWLFVCQHLYNTSDELIVLEPTTHTAKALKVGRWSFKGFKSALVPGIKPDYWFVT